MFLPKEARFQTLLNLPEGAKIGQKINEAMKAIEEENKELKRSRHSQEHVWLTIRSRPSRI